MGIPILGDIINAVKDLASEVIVDKDEKNRIGLELDKLAAEADRRLHEELMGQIEINKVEAAHPSVFVAGWRPFIGWVSGVGLAYTYVLAPFIEFIARAGFSYQGVMPTPDANQLMVLVTSLLGVGAMRSYDKLKGTDTDRVVKK